MSKCDKCLLEFADVDDDVTSSLAVELMEAKGEIAPTHLHGRSEAEDM